MDNRTIRLSDAIEALKAEKVHGDDCTDVSYDLAIDHAIEALSALPAVGGEKSNMERLKAKLYGNPKTAVSDIKFTKGERDDVSIEEIAGVVLAAIEDVENGGGRDVDLSI